jgi:hypothetical protein
MANQTVHSVALSALRREAGDVRVGICSHCDQFHQVDAQGMPMVNSDGTPVTFSMDFVLGPSPGFTLVW